MDVEEYLIDQINYLECRLGDKHDPGKLEAYQELLDVIQND